MIYIQGKVVGVLDKQGQPKTDEKTGQVTPGNYYGVIGIQTAGVDRNGFETLTTVTVNAYRDNYASRLHDKYKPLIGQEVLMPVEIGVSKSQNGSTSLSYYIGGLPLKPAIEAFEPVRKSPAELVAQGQAARAAAAQPAPAQAARA